MSLFELSCYSSGRQIGLENYADLIILDKEGNIAGLRFGGYPELVTAMTDAIAAGCTIYVRSNDDSFAINSKNYSNFSRKTTHNGFYAESVMFLKDSEQQVANSENKSESSHRKMFIYCKTDSKDELFEALDKKLFAPIIPEFAEYLIDELYKKDKLKKLTVLSKNVEIFAYSLVVKGDESDVIKIIADGLKSGKINIPGEYVGKDVFHEINGFSDYLSHFGTHIAQRIKSSFSPLFDPESEQICDKLDKVNKYVKQNAGYELFDAQLASSEGLKRQLDKAKLALIVAECGTGKTKIGSAALYAHQNSKSFNAVICPSHVCEKWVRELHETIPNCYARVVDNFAVVDKMYNLYKTQNKSIYCVISKEKARDGYMKIPAKGAYRHYPLSLYIKNKIGRLDGLIVDELHQYSGDSGQGQAMCDLAKVAKKVVAMTATLINGYSKGMFYLLFRLAPLLMKLDEQVYTKSTDFCRKYGVVQEIYTQELEQINSMSKGKKSPTREKFLPGVSPLVYTRFLLDNTVFLSLTDMNKELPDYEEIPISVTLTSEIKQEYDRLQNEFLRLIKTDRRMAQKLMSTYLNLLTAYPDQPYGHPPIMNPFDDQDVLISPKSIGDIEQILPKDEEVINLVESKIATGEKAIIFTAWTRLDTREKLYNLLTKKGYRVKILDVNIPAKKREEWVEKQLKNSIDVLITNPSLVETGLDLNAFTTLIFYNLAFNLYVFRQASRRSWRINQTAPKVEVYMFYYAETLQHKVLKLMASKLSAATIIEGGISDEGLAALSECEDMTSRMAKELAAGIKDSVEDLTVAFKKMALVKKSEELDKIEPQIVPKITMVKTNAKPNNKPVQYTLFDLLAS